jgi:hypothetical protein
VPPLLATTSKEIPTYPVGSAGAAEQAPLAVTLTRLVAEIPVPVSCNMHGTANVQPASCTRGPFTVNVPISKL